MRTDGGAGLPVAQGGDMLCPCSCLFLVLIFLLCPTAAQQPPNNTTVFVPVPKGNPNAIAGLTIALVASILCNAVLVFLLCRLYNPTPSPAEGGYKNLTSKSPLWFFQPDGTGRTSSRAFDGALL
eukprot:Sspe_Gene.91701::Locus_63283_Transcript_1_1_Confidence_1.000_Length_696::g.91701::m.91701